METLFAGTRVLDLSTVLAGPSVATFFAELGATVMKVENPRTKGDVTRSWKLSSENAVSDISAYFASVNYRKSYVWIDFSANDSRPQLEELIRTSDIIITNFKEGDDRKFKLTSQDVHELQPKAIIASLKGFQSHPNRIAYDVVLQAECGFMFMNGTEQSGPLKMPVALIDVIAAHQLKEGILCALLRRSETGKGSTVRVTLEEAALSALANQASNYLMAGHIAQAAGSLHPNIAPYGETFQCSDNKRLVLAVGSDAQFNRLCEVVGFDELKKAVMLPLICPNCSKPMNTSHANKKMWSIHRMCLNCVVDMETKLKKEGKYQEYEKGMILNGIKVHIKELEDALLDIALNSNNESFVTEAGDIEQWKGNDDTRQRIITELTEYIKKLKETTDS
jgi:crotonobetainyl-CoA:carnitine CoA-transferase CaiB-like acyl-CoA transferase